MKHPAVRIPVLKVREETMEELRRKEVLQKRYGSSWIWKSVAAIVDVSPDSRSPLWISRKLNISVNESVEALEGLEALGILERLPQGYRRILKFFFHADQHKDPRSLLGDHALLSSQILSRLRPEDPHQKSFFRTGFVATNETLVREFCFKFEALMKDFLEASAREPSDRVVGLTFSTVKMTQD